jgi:hypothetical protein
MGKTIEFRTDLCCLAIDLRIVHGPSSHLHQTKNSILGPSSHTRAEPPHPQSVHRSISTSRNNDFHHQPMHDHVSIVYQMVKFTSNDKEAQQMHKRFVFFSPKKKRKGTYASATD